MQEGDELLVITQQGMILRMQTNDVRAIGRATQGVRLIDIEGDDKVVSIARLVEKEDEDAARTARRRHAAGRMMRRDASAASSRMRGARCRCAARPARTARCSTQFFAASRLRDLTALQKIATVVFEPTRDGIVTSFEITGVTQTAGSTKRTSRSRAGAAADGARSTKRFVVTVQRRA